MGEIIAWPTQSPAEHKRAKRTSEEGWDWDLMGCYILQSVTRLTSPAYRKWTFATLGLLIYAYTETHLYSNDSALFLGTLGGLVCALRAPSPHAGPAIPRGVL